MKWLILVSHSMTTRMVSYSSDFGRSVMKSIAIEFHFDRGPRLTVAIRRVHVRPLSSSDMCRSFL